MNWQQILHYLGQSLGVIFYCLAQLVALVLIPLGLPGIWFQVLAAVIVTLSTGLVGWWWTAAIVAVAIVGELLDLLLGDLGLSSVGASKPAAWGALLFGFFFAFFGSLIPLPIPGLGAMVMSFIGTFVGAAAGEMYHEKKLHPKFHVALGAVLGRACGISAKLSLCFVACGIALTALLLELAKTLAK